jgi:hypothetical protein
MFSKDFEWFNWCEKEGIFICESSNCYQLEISFNKFIIIDSFDKLMNFDSKYKLIDK